ncbi:hypothetical protein E4H12_05160 [Candidatus Thorarchaeota archaeon]|nr:MAG: hypothetical protein E4H12_05160 [Candidatus Thorarchaeota archaeon]
MSDESSRSTIGIDQFERQIGNLRCAITVLGIAVALLLGYIILQPLLSSLGIFFILVLGMLLLIACLSANDKR